MSQEKDRIRELEQILLFIAGGLRSKARVYQNMVRINPAVAGDPVAILNAAADEVQIAAGCSMVRVKEEGSKQMEVCELKLAVGDRLTFWGPGENDSVVAKVRIDIEQMVDQLQAVHLPDSPVLARRPAGMSLAISIQPNVEPSGASHDRILH